MPRWFGGGGGIRTHETLAGLTVFKTAAIDHSATPPTIDYTVLAALIGKSVERVWDSCRSSTYRPSSTRLSWLPRSNDRMSLVFEHMPGI